MAYRQSETAATAKLVLSVSCNQTIPRNARVSISAHHALDATRRCSATQIWTDPVAATRLGLAQPDAWLLGRLRHLAYIWPPLGRLLEHDQPATLRLDDEELEEFLINAIPALEQRQVNIELPHDLVTNLSIRADIEDANVAQAQSVFNLRSLCSVSLTALLNGAQLSADELKQLSETPRRIVRIRDSFVRVDSRLLGSLNSELTMSDALTMALNEDNEVNGTTVNVNVAPPLRHLVEGIKQLADPQPTESVPGVHAEFRHYQQRGITWLDGVAQLMGGGVLADDMGLGKTLQIIALHALRSSGPTLVVGPAALVTNWERELHHFAPKIPVHRFQGPTRSLSGVRDRDVVLTSYATLRLDHAVLEAFGWWMVVADEAQHIKNHRSATARAIRLIPSEVRIAVTGTPVENRLEDLWAIMDWCLPGLLGNRTNFQRRYVSDSSSTTTGHGDHALRTLTGPFVLRRSKSSPSIAPDLPSRTEIDHVVPLTPEQAVLYRHTTREILDQLDASVGIQRRGLVLKLLTSLKQICNHPALWLRQQGPLDGRSGKLDALDELVTEMIQADDAVLVFTQYVQMGHLLCAHLSSRGIANEFLHGGTPLASRDLMVSRFQSSTHPQVLVISIKAGGTGLNLTRANHVIHFDRWWNPAVEDQASDRSWRIGQTKPVFVHRLISENTLEETIHRELVRKRDLANRVIGSTEQWLSELDSAGLRALVELSDQREP